MKSNPYISEEVKGQVAALEAREKALARREKRVWPVVGALAVGSVAAGFLAQYLGPDAYPSTIDVPARILELFSTDGFVNSVGGLDSPVQEASQGIGRVVDLVTGRFLFGISVLSMVSGGAALMFGAELTDGVKKVVSIVTIIGMMLSFAGILGTAFMTLDDNYGSPVRETRSTPRKAFMEAVQSHQFAKVAKSLDMAWVPKADAAAAQYVLAQVALADKKAASAFAVDAALAGQVASPSAGFSPTGEALYAIELAAYGAPKSPVAMSYQDQTLSRQGWAKTGSVVLAGFCATVAVMGFGLLALRKVIARRVRRIYGLLAA